ncbi:STAS domain-containing protein [Streptomyces sp. J2-1]|uniref:STAS domain-containing protein n=1 Tax=Streptomyces corallincola TaxID=2851888 RepID=UPI001C37EA0C|nr:STAS domain-containing protein [Streptomyces corallincola]MBV2354121.1 STAS domain-containing protein [Streptomyces corallincola]
MTTMHHDDSFDLTTVRDEAGDPRIGIVGALDWDTADDLTRTASACLGADPAPRRLSLDCARLTLCDSLGLASLLMIQRRAAEVGTLLRLLNRPPSLQRILEITGTSDVLAANGAETGELTPPEPDRATTGAPLPPPQT